ncbi:MAG: uroporphyrinogen decarboxylase family protein [Candidatus Ratteibacteria bacterium]
MTSRERILRTLNHQIPDKVPIHDSPWGATVKRWYKEGLPEDTSPAEFFGYEFEFFGADTSPRFPVKVIEKNEEYIITTTPTGGKRRNHRDYSTTPEIIDWPIKTKDDWKEIKKLLKPDWTRVDWASGLSRNKTAYEEGKFCVFSGGYGYDILQSYMKSEQLLITMIEDPDWVREMIMTLAELTLIMADLMIRNGFKFDGAFLYNDMGYRNGLLFSPDTYMKTHYQADKIVFEYFHSKGMKVLLHSCGNVKELIPILIEVGLDCLQPLEVKAGMDLIELKEKYGDKLSFMGGIDVRLMADPDPSKIEEEIKRKFEVAKKNGGYIYHSDHSVPKDVSFKQYLHVMELVKKYGVYPEYEEIEKQEREKIVIKGEKAEIKKELPEQEKKKRFSLFGKKK